MWALMHYLRKGIREGRYPTYFDPEYYLSQYPDVAATNLSPLSHYIRYGFGEGRSPTRTWIPRTETQSRNRELLALIKDFEESFHGDAYLAANPDVAEVGADPLQHYLTYGAFEGRPVPPSTTTPGIIIHPGAQKYNPDLKSVVVVSHEATVTGAPMLVASLCRQLNSILNVAVVSLLDGPLIPDFQEVSCGVIAGPQAAELLGTQIHGHTQDATLPEVFSHLDFILINTVNATVDCAHLRLVEELPVIALLHEPPTPVRYLDFATAFHAADLVVFSSQKLRDAAVRLLNASNVSNTLVLPQGRVTSGRGASLSHEESMVRADNDRRQRIFLGAGSVLYRKGTDLFLDVAEKLTRLVGEDQVRFIWVGNTGEPEFTGFVNESLNRLRKTVSVEIFPTTNALDELIRDADAFLMTSRHDPLPNVALDAIWHAKPIYYFDDSGGLPEYVERLRDANLYHLAHMSPRADAAAMVEQLHKDWFSSESESGSRLPTMTSDEITALRNNMSFATYATTIAEAFESALARRQHTLELRSRYSDQGEVDAYKYFYAHAHGVGRMRPEPSFHPGIYAKHSQRDVETVEAYDDYVTLGRPSGPWKSEVITQESHAPIAPPPTALHMHVYYLDQLSELLDRLESNTFRPDLYITHPYSIATDEIRGPLIEREMLYATIAAVPNRGRDLAALLYSLQLFDKHYEIIGHVHTKESKDVADRDVVALWKDFLFENTIGGQHGTIDTIVSYFQQRPEVGLVVPADSGIIGWGINGAWGELLSYKVGISFDEFDHFDFPIGSMFWARHGVYAVLRSLGLSIYDFPPEPLPYDGTIAHALERLIGLIPSSIGLETARIRMPGTFR
jgi:hypothetical protein